MSEGLNEVRLIGNLGQDPELRHTQSGQAVMSLRIATNESYFDKQANERKERVEWHSIVVWGPRAEGLNKFLAKGSRIHVAGRLQTRQWEDKEGIKRSTTEVVATNVLLLGDGKGKGGDRAPHPADDAGHAGHAGDSQPDAAYSDDIPFAFNECESVCSEYSFGERWHRRLFGRPLF